MQHDELLEKYILAMKRFGRLNMPVLFKRVSKGEFFLLELLYGHMREYREGMNVSAIADRLGVSPPAVSRMLRAMHNRELINRGQYALDRRNTLISITEKGDTIRKEQEQIIAAFLEGVITLMGTERMKAFVALWNVLTDIMETQIKQIKMMKGIMEC